MKLSRKLISQIEAHLEETNQSRFGEVVVRFIRHEGRVVKVRIECYNSDVEETIIDRFSNRPSIGGPQGLTAEARN